MLKTGHHGSAYSSTEPFIAAIHPRVALISVGRHNLFGHPAATTLSVLESAGAAVYRTDRCGALVLRIHEVTSIQTTLPCRDRTAQ